ncbi:MAG: sigma-70 family RNA polymerase sigma factor [Bradymonadaceae bacterium]|nr:sigma-70 family RNA polymerase sigma factor [Lujinxingiaceae bacterium]
MSEESTDETPAPESAAPENVAPENAPSGWQLFALAAVYWPTILVGFLASSYVLVSASTWGLLWIVLLGGTLWKGTMWGWRTLAVERFRTGVLVGLLSWFYGPVYAALALSAAVGVMGAPDDTPLLEKAKTFLELVAESADEQAPSVASAGPESQGSDFNACIDALHQHSDTRSMRAEAIAVLKKDLAPELAEDTVHDVMIDVCLRYEAGRVRELRHYFFKSLDNARKDVHKKNSRWRYCEFDERDLPPDRQPTFDEEAHLQLVQAAMCRIDSRQAHVLRRHADGKSYRTIASELSTSETNARQLHRRGKIAVRNEVKNLM